MLKNYFLIQLKNFLQMGIDLFLFWQVTTMTQQELKQGFHLQMPPGEEEYIEHLPEELLRMNDPL